MTSSLKKVASKKVELKISRPRIDEEVFENKVLGVYKDLVEQSNDAILLTSLKGKIFYVNRSACKLFGRTKKELYMLGRDRIIYQKDPTVVKLMKMRNSEKGVIGELNFTRKDGKQIIAEISFKNFNTQEGVRTSLVIRDITGRSKDQMEIRSSEAKYRRLFSNSLIGISHVAEDGTLLFGNESYAKIYGYKSFEQMQKRVKNVKTLYSNPIERKEVIQKLNKDEMIGPSEFCVVRRDGTRAYVLATVQKVYDDNGRFLYNEATHIDISEKKILEDLKWESEEILRTTVQNAPIVLYAIDKNGMFLLSEGRGLLGTGLIPGELVGKSAIETTKNVIVTLENGKQIQYPELIKKVLRGIKLKGWTIYNNVHFEHQFIPVFNKNGKVLRMIGVATDITASKVKEEEIFQSREKLRALSIQLQKIKEEERTFLARELHDNFGQNLTGLKMDLAWIKKRIQTKSKNLKVVKEKIEMNMLLLDAAIKSIRRISTMLRPIYLDTLGLIPAIEFQIEELKKRTELEIDYEKEAIQVNFDPQKSISIYRIVQECFTNILRHSKATKVLIRISSKRKKFRIEIEDNGIGISETQLQHTESLGITGMKERALYIGADLSIMGENKKGTKIILSVPMEGK